MNKYIVFFLCIALVHFASAGREVSAGQIWADQQCGGSAAYKKDEKKFNACVEAKLESKSLDEYLRDCKRLVLESDPGKDPKDADMLCNDPYLKGKPNESYEDQVRRKRLIKEAEEAKRKVLEKYVAPAAGQPASSGAR